MTATISIITPIKNGIKYFEDCIQSIINQQGHFKIQYIVVDGLSNDGSYELAMKYQRELTHTFQPGCESIEMLILREPDQSLYEALAKGFKVIKGDIVAYLNSDDYFLPGSFTKVADIFKSNDRIDWISGRPLSVFQDRNLKHSHLPFPYESELIKTGFYGEILPFIQQENIFFRRKLLTLIDLEKLITFKLAGDFYLWKCFAGSADLYVNTSSFAVARIHPERLSAIQKKYFKEYHSIRSKRTLKHYFKVLIHGCLHLLPSDRWKLTLSKKYLKY